MPSLFFYIIHLIYTCELINTTSEADRKEPKLTVTKSEADPKEPKLTVTKSEPQFSISPGLELERNQFGSLPHNRSTYFVIRSSNEMKQLRIYSKRHFIG